MSDEIASLTLEYLKRFDIRLERIENEFKDVKFRLGQIEETKLHLIKRLDRMDDRLDRIEKKMDLVKV